MDVFERKREVMRQWLRSKGYDYESPVDYGSREEDSAADSEELKNKREHARNWHRKNADVINEQRRERYRNDPKNRQKRIASARASNAKSRERIAARKRERYRNDPEYRQKLLDDHAAYRQKKKESEPAVAKPPIRIYKSSVAARDYENRRYRDEDEVRKRKNAQAAAWKRIPKNRNRINALHNERYHSDPEYRERHIERAKKSYRKHKEIRTARQRERYQNDPEYRAKLLERQRVYRLQKKEERNEQRSQ